MASYKVKTGTNTWTEYFKSYESKSAASGGTALSLVTTGEKYIWNNKANSLIPTVIGTATSSSNKFVFNLGTSSTSPNLNTNGGLGVFTFGYCSTILNLYGLTSGTTYKTVGTFIYNSSGSVVTTTINYKYTKNSTTNKLEIWSGNSDKKIQNSYTGYLFLVKLT